MNTSLSVRNQSCPNLLCRFKDLKLAGNVVVHSSKDKRFKCKSCGKTWVMYRHELRYGLRTDLKKVESAKELLKQGTSVRIVAHAVEVSPSTVQRWKERMKGAGGQSANLQQMQPVNYFDENHNYFLTF